jgi:hypothetical protein
MVLSASAAFFVSASINESVLPVFLFVLIFLILVFDLGFDIKETCSCLSPRSLLTV